MHGLKERIPDAASIRRANVEGLVVGGVRIARGSWRVCWHGVRQHQHRESLRKPFVLEPETKRPLLTGKSVDAYFSTGTMECQQNIVKVNAVAPYSIFVAARLDVDEVLVQRRSRAQSAVVSLQMCT